jgi:hypothetical protein
MRKATTVAAVLLCAACSKGADDSAAAADSARPARPAMSAASLAGTWNFRIRNTTGDTLPSFSITAGADSTAWTMTLAGREPMPLRVLAMSADSVTTEAGPFPSVLRPGVQVRVTTTLRLQREGRLVGTGVARYSVRTADSVMGLRLMGTRQP